MDISFVVAWWWPPVFVTLVAFVFVIWVAGQELRQGGWFCGLGTAIAMIPASLVVALAWALAGIFK